MSMSSTTYLKLFVDCLEKYQKLNDTEFGRLVRAALRYKATGAEPDELGREALLWDGMRLDLHIVPITSTKGANHWNWKGGITPENQRDRNSKEAREWRKNVFSRDDYTCQICHKKGGKINAHHIIPWSENKSLRYELSNGVTLCEKCHKSVHRRNR